MSIKKVFAKGDLICREGDKIQNLYLLQSGIVLVFLPRPKKNFELYQLTAGQVVGEMALFGNYQHMASVQALTECTVIELPVDAVRAQVEASAQIQKLLIK